MPSVEAVESGICIEPQHYPWHGGQWELLTRNLERLPHALLLHGQAGLGKNAFALRFAQWLLCLDRTGDAGPCGHCRSCALFRVGNHPDLLRVSPQEDSSNILVDQIRGVIEFLSFKPHTASYKIVLISPAEAMNVNAANSLLKALEEPPPNSLLILVATHLSRVPATLRSRCTRVVCSAPPLPHGLAWLRSHPDVGSDPEKLLVQAGGSPLIALTLADNALVERQMQLGDDLSLLAQRKADPLACAERWKSAGTEACLDWLHRFISHTLRNQGVSSSQSTVEFVFSSGKIFYISIIDLFNYLDNVSISKKQLGTGVDETLMLEQLLLHWCEMTESTSRN